MRIGVRHLGLSGNGGLTMRQYQRNCHRTANVHTAPEPHLHVVAAGRLHTKKSSPFSLAQRLLRTMLSASDAVRGSVGCVRRLRLYMALSTVAKDTDCASFGDTWRQTSSKNLAKSRIVFLCLTLASGAYLLTCRLSCLHMSAHS